MNPSTRHYATPILPDLSSRWFGPEIMDDPLCEKQEFDATLASFRPINRLFSGYASVFRRYLLPRIKMLRPGPVTILDLGCGACDIPRWLSAWCRSKGIKARIICVDANPRACEFARRACAADPSICVVCSDIFSLDMAKIGADFIIANHLFHHIETARIAHFLRLVDSAHSRGFLLSDIHRSRGAYLLYSVASLFFFKSGFARHDGRISIRRSFTQFEMRNFVEMAGLSAKAQVVRAFPFRCIVVSFSREGRIAWN